METTKVQTQQDQQVDPKTVKKYYAFKSRIINSNYVFKDGTQAQFKGGQYVTENETFAKELLDEIAKGNIYIYQEAGKEMLSEEDLDPLAQLKKQIIAEYEAQRTAATEGTKDFGTSEQSKLAALNSIDVASLTAGSNSK